MEQRLLVTINQDVLQCKKIHFRLLELHGDDALSYSEVCSWSRQFLFGWENVENARKTKGCKLGTNFIILFEKS
jgi:hypothetical protein